MIRFLPLKHQLYKTLLFKNSFSDCGEDLILRHLFEHSTKGFYIDIGAFHPILHSNSYLFYLNGWRGINIDARPGSMSDFRKIRKYDINIEAAISDKEQQLKYYIVRNAENMNSFSLENLKYLGVDGNIKETIQIQTVRLEEILKKNLPSNTKIDFLSIDVEGLELSVLNSNDWNKYRPKIILMESFEKFYNENADASIKDYLKERDYLPITKTINSIIFMDKYQKLNNYNSLI